MTSARDAPGYSLLVTRYSFCFLEVDAEGDRDVREIAAGVLVAEHLVIAHFGEGADHAEREADAHATVDADRVLAVRGDRRSAEGGLAAGAVVAEAGDDIRQAEPERAVGRCAEDVRAGVVVRG